MTVPSRPLGSGESDGPALSRVHSVADHLGQHLTAFAS